MVKVAVEVDMEGESLSEAVSRINVTAKKGGFQKVVFHSAANPNDLLEVRIRPKSWEGF